MVFTRLPLTTTSRRRGACAWAAPISAHPVKNTNSLRVVIGPPPGLLRVEPARYCDGHDIESHPARRHRKRRAGAFRGALRRPGANVGIKLNDKDVGRAKELINYRWFRKKHWQEEIKRMLATGLKYELDALATRTSVT